MKNRSSIFWNRIEEVVETKNANHIWYALQMRRLQLLNLKKFPRLCLNILVKLGHYYSLIKKIT